MKAPRRRRQGGGHLSDAEFDGFTGDDVRFTTKDGHPLRDRLGQAEGGETFAYEKTYPRRTFPTWSQLFLKYALS